MTKSAENIEKKIEAQLEKLKQLKAQKQKLRHLKDAFEKSSASFVEVNPEIDYTKILYSYFQKK